MIKDTKQPLDYVEHDLFEPQEPNSHVVTAVLGLFFLLAFGVIGHLFAWLASFFF